VLGLGCSDTGDPLAGVLATVLLVSGEGQVDTVGQQVPLPLVARVLNASGDPISGQIVNFRVIKGGGSVFAGAAISNADGQVQELWTLGTVAADSQVVEVRAVDPATGEPRVYARFIATALPDSPVAVTVESGNAQTVVAGATLSDSLLSRVVDQYGNAVPGAAVTWSVTSGGGTLTRTADVSTQTGMVSTKWTPAGTAGVAGVSVSGSGMTPAVFTATVVASTAVGLQLISNPTVSAVVATPFIAQVKVVDAFGNGVKDTLVWFCDVPPNDDCSTVGRRGSYSNAAGVATIDWALPTVAGTHTLRGEFAPTARAEITMIGAPDVAYYLEAIEAFPYGAAPGAPGANVPAVRVKDRFSNPAPGVEMLFTITKGGGSVANPVATTNAAGVASAGSWIMGPRTGDNQILVTRRDSEDWYSGAPFPPDRQFDAEGRFADPGVSASFSIDRKVTYTMSVGDCIDVIVTASATQGLASVTLDVPGRTKSIPVSEFADGTWRGWFSLVGVGDTTTLVLIATDVQGAKRSSFRFLRHDPAVPAGTDCTQVSSAMASKSSSGF
jgi:hypothetical protein